MGNFGLVRVFVKYIWPNPFRDENEFYILGYILMDLPHAKAQFVNVCEQHPPELPKGRFAALLLLCRDH